jgi:hypothetical protein
MTLAAIMEKLDHINGVSGADTSGEQRTDLADLHDLLGLLDEMTPETPAATERIDEPRGRIEILMDDIEFSLGIEPPPIYPPRTWTPNHTEREVEVHHPPASLPAGRWGVWIRRPARTRWKSTSKPAPARPGPQVPSASGQGRTGQFRAELRAA